MYIMSDEVKTNLEESLGISLSALNAMSADEQKEWIRNKNKENRRNRQQMEIKNNINHAGCKKYLGHMGYMEPLLSRSKICTIEDLEKKSIRLFGI